MSLEGMEETLSEATANSPATADVEVSGAVVGAILDILSQTGSRIGDMLPLCCILIGVNEPFLSSFSKTTTAGDKVLSTTELLLGRCTEVATAASDDLVQCSMCQPVCRLTFSQSFFSASKVLSSACSMNHHLGFPEEEIQIFRLLSKGYLSWPA